MAGHGKPAEDGPASSLLPIPKIAAAGGIGVPAGLLIGWIFDMPDPVAGAAGALVAALIGYLKSDSGYLKP